VTPGAAATHGAERPPDDAERQRAPAASQLGTGEVRVYCAAIASPWAQTARDLLTEEDLAPLSALRRERRRAEYSTSRALLRFALQSCTGRAARSHRIHIASTGKPECIDGPAVSVSHSGNVAACAVATLGQLGLDVEIPSPRRSTAAIAQHYFTPAENEWLRGRADDAFYMLWVLKEAYLKAAGAGLAGGLHSLECRIDGSTIVRLAPVAGDAPMLALYRFGAGFLALATVGHGFSSDRTTFVNPPDSGPLPPVRLVASSP
jgi:phosphopantetheinyl transferase